MNKSFVLFLLIFHSGIILAQNSVDTIKNNHNNTNADDPSQFISRVEIYNELQRYSEKDFFLNQSVVRFVVKLGKRLTSRVDIPYVYNSYNTEANYLKYGLGDISFRLLGYKIFETQNSALTTSLEVSTNTAQSPILGTGKNMLIPMITYSQVIPKEKILISFAFQQVNSVSGDEERKDVKFSKIQFFLIKKWTPKVWAVLQPEWYFDYVNGGVSMNLRSRLTYAPNPRLNIWVTPSAGIFGEFIGRYQWSVDVGCRYYLMRK